MAIYDKPIWSLLKQYASECELTPGDIFTRDQVFEWFDQNYPKIKANSLQCQLVKLSTNCPSRAHYHVDVEGRDDVFYRIDPDHFRLYEPGIDPKPFYTFRLRKPTDHSLRHQNKRFASQWWQLRPFDQVTLQPIIRVSRLSEESEFYHALGFLVRTVTETFYEIHYNGVIMLYLEQRRGGGLPPCRDQHIWQFVVNNMKRFNQFVEAAGLKVEEPLDQLERGRYTITLRSPNDSLLKFVGR